MLMNLCNVCPRKCNINRATSPGFCGVNDKLIIRKVMLHQYEEPILVNSEDKGSGTIFFAGCNLKCVYCQNYDVSHTNNGKEISILELVEIFKKLERAGAGNIDLVSPTHYTNQIIEALKIYKPKIPVIWNTGGYESPETINKLNGFVDIFLTDFKYANDDYSFKYSKAKDYVINAKNSLITMKKYKNENIFVKNKLVSGIIVRHMVLPTLVKDSINVLNIIAEILGTDAIISLMSQYVPMGKAVEYNEINRKITPLEYKTVVSYAKKLGFKNAFIQDLESSSSSYTPNFNSQIIDL